MILGTSLRREEAGISWTSASLIFIQISFLFKALLAQTGLAFYHLLQILSPLEDSAGRVCISVSILLPQISLSSQIPLPQLVLWEEYSMDDIDKKLLKM